MSDYSVLFDGDDGCCGCSGGGSADAAPAEGGGEAPAEEFGGAGEDVAE